jgi:hypothetical protein
MIHADMNEDCPKCKSDNTYLEYEEGGQVLCCNECDAVFDLIVEVKWVERN